MSVSFAPSGLQPPAGFQELLWDLSHAVLRDQPQDVYGYAAKYFRDLAEKRGQAPQGM